MGSQIPKAEWGENYLLSETLGNQTFILEHKKTGEEFLFKIIETTSRSESAEY